MHWLTIKSSLKIVYYYIFRNRQKHWRLFIKIFHLSNNHDHIMSSIWMCCFPLSSHTEQYHHGETLTVLMLRFIPRLYRMRRAHCSLIFKNAVSVLSKLSWCYICNKVYAIPPQENMDYHFSSHQIISLLWLVSETLSFKGSYFVMIDSYLIIVRCGECWVSHHQQWVSERAVMGSLLVRAEATAVVLLVFQFSWRNHNSYAAWVKPESCKL